MFRLYSNVFDDTVGDSRRLKRKTKKDMDSEKEEEQGQVLMAEHKYGERSDKKGSWKKLIVEGCTKWKDTDEANLIQDEEPALL
ncbi:hypothetical protein Tco_1500410 [Tanacetum coccineum]